MLPPLKNYNNLSSNNLPGFAVISQPNFEAESRALEMKNKVLEDLLKERDKLIDDQNSEIRVLKNALLLTGRQEEQLKIRIEELLLKIKKLENRLKRIPDMLGNVDQEAASTLAVLEPQDLSPLARLDEVEEIKDLDNGIDPETFPLETKKIYKSGSLDLIFQETNVPDLDSDSSAKTAETPIIVPLKGILKNSPLRKLPEIVLRPKRVDDRVRQDKFTTPVLPQWKKAKNGVKDSKSEPHKSPSRSPSPTKSMLIHERDALEEELLIQYERLRFLST